MDYLSKRKGYKRMLLEKLPFFLLTVLFVYIGVIGQSEGGALNSNDEIPFIKRPFIACYGLVMYSVKTLIPSNLSAFYPYPSIVHLPWYIYASSIPVIGSVIYILKQWKRKPVLVFGSFFFMISIFPVSQIIPFGTAIIADRYTYLPYLGIFFLFAFYFEKLIEKQPFNPLLKKGLLFLFGGYIIVLGGATLNRSKVWKNDDTLWTDVLKEYPNNYFALGNLGDYWFNEGNDFKALDYYNRTIELEGRYFMAYNNRGVIYQGRGDSARAIVDFNKAIELKKYPKAYINKGVLLFQQGNNLRAIEAFKKGLELDEKYALAWFNLGNVYYKIGELDLALESFNEAEGLGYQHIYLYLLRADIYNSKEMEDLVFLELQKGLEIYPNNEDGLIELSKFYLRARKMEEALLQINKTIEIYSKGKKGEAYYLRSIIYNEIKELELSKADLLRAKELGYSI
jgi:tetratricopeptide (TPR) repeat protein